MSLTPVEVAGANFRTDTESDQLNTEFMERLGLRSRNLPARLAIARSLNVPEAPPSLQGGRPESTGKIIKGDALFGSGTALLLWLSLLIQHAGTEYSDTRGLIAVVGAHWRRGLRMLDEDWQAVDGNFTKFVEGLLAGFPATSTGRLDVDEPFSATDGGIVEIPLGELAEDTQTGKQTLWGMNAPAGSPHSAVMGGVGTGKTRTAAAMLRSFRKQTRTPLLAFDFKGDLGAGGYEIDQLFSARVLEPPRQPIPLDVLHLGNQRSDIDLSEAASRFRESFGRLKGSRVGDRQRSLLHDAAQAALARHQTCELHHIHDCLRAAYEEQEQKHDGALATMEEICRFPLFQPEHDPVSFFRQSWIIKLPPNVAEDSRTIVVNLMLDALDRYLNSLPEAEVGPDGARSLRILCMIDEAHRVLGTKLPSLSNLIRMSRSKGGAIMLISQSPDDFSGEEDDFLAEMGLVVAFGTNAPPRNAARILGRQVRLTALGDGECLVKMRGDRTPRKIQSWRKNKDTSLEEAAQ